MEDIQDYIEKVTVNNTDKHLIIDRKDPGNVVLLKYTIVKPCPKTPLFLSCKTNSSWTARG